MKLIVTSIFLLLGSFSYSQQANNFELPTSINDTGLDPDASSILDVQSTDKGVLFPRMTLTERAGISTPIEGLLIFQTDNDPGFYYYSAGSWNQIISDKKVFDPSLPFGTEDLVGVHVAVTDSNPFIVPADSNFYGFVDWYDRLYFPAYFNSYALNGYSWTRLYLGPGDIITTNATTNDKVIVHGYTGPNDDVEVLFTTITQGQTYTVPAGKQLFLERINLQPLNFSKEVYIDGLEIKWGSTYGNVAPGTFLLLEAGSTVTSNVGNNEWVHLSGYFR